MNRRLLGAKKVSLLHSFSRAMEFLSIMFSLFFVCDGHFGVTFEEVLMLQGLRERECWL